MPNIILRKTDVIKLAFAHSVIMGHMPDKVTPEMLAHKAELDKRVFESFGLFDSASPNFHTYYPDVTAEDLQPKPEDYINPVFRALSEVIVHRKHNPIDFTVPGVLKASMNKLVGQAVYPNHEAMIGNELGSVPKVFWQDAYITSTGAKVPAGFNAVLKIDGKSHPKVARGILSDPPSIHSTSVTVEFGWEKSHSKMTDTDFWSKLGTLGPDKQMVRRMANEIKNYHEISLVAHGADPYAQKHNPDGEIINPKYANQTERFGLTHNPRVYYFSYKEDTTKLSAESAILENNNITDPVNQKQNKMFKNSIMALAALAGIILAPDMVSLSDDNFEEKFDLAAFQALLKPKLATAEQIAAVTALAAATADVTRLTGELATANNEKVILVKDAGIGKTALAAKLAEVIRLQGILSKGADFTALKTTYEAADFATLSAFETALIAQLGSAYTHKCNKCGASGNNISRQSADVSQVENPEKDNETTLLSQEEIMHKYSKSRKHLNGEKPKEGTTTK